MGLARRLLRNRVNQLDTLLILTLIILLIIHHRPPWNSQISPAAHNKPLYDDSNSLIFKKPVIEIPVPSTRPAGLHRSDRLRPTKKLLNLRKARASVDPLAVKFIMPEKVYVNDVRREDCESVQKPKYKLYGNVSIIIDASVTNIQYLAVTVISVLHTTKRNLVTEVTVVVDGSVPEFLYKMALSLFSGVQIVRFVYHIEEGQIAARMKGASIARENVYVFVESGVWLTVGWLEPLLHWIQQHPKTIAMPTYDNSVLSPIEMEYNIAPYDRAHVIQWSLQTAFYPVFEIRPRQIAMDSPAIRKDIFVIRRDHFYDFGEYDLNLNDRGAGHVEMSLRQWMCYGPIKIIRCSHAAIYDVSDITAGSVSNIQYIASLWLKKTSENITRALGTMVQISKIPAINQRQHQLEAINLTCDKTDVWFGQSMMPEESFEPDTDQIVQTGQLKSGPGLCHHIQRNGSLYLDECTSTAPRFHLMRNGQIKHDETGKCILAARIFHVLETCVNELAENLWMHTNDGRLHSLGTTRCMMQMSHAKNKSMQIPVGQRCGRITDESKEFATWSFV